VSSNLLRREDVQRIEIAGHALLMLRIPKASRAQRPVHLNGSWERKTYLRVHEGDRVADRDVARRMLADAQPDRDAHVLEGYSAADLHVESVRQYRQLFASRRPDHPFLREEDAGFLRQIGVLGRDRSRGVEGLTLGGLLMLGREDAIRDRFPHWHLSYREVPAHSLGGPRWLDRIAPDGTWNANLFEFYSRVIGKLHETLKVPFALEAGLFRRDDTAAHTAVREAFINTLIHADYEGQAGVRVIRDPSGYEFINPGLLLVSIEQVWRGGVSESRNPVVQRLFSMLQLGEREGSGGPAIVQAWRQQHWRAPRLWEDVNHSECHLQLRHVSLLPEESVTAVRAQLGAQFEALDELGRLAVVTAHAEGSFHHARLRELTNDHSRDITLKLQELVRKKVLVASGNTRATTYRMGPGSTHAASGSEQTSPGSEQTSLSSEQTSPGSEQTSPGSEQTSPGSEQTSPGSEQTSPGSEQTSLSSEQTSLSSEQTSPGSEQAPLDSGQPRGWLPKDQQFHAILSFCTEGWRTLPEIALALNRTESTVRTQYLRPLLSTGALERRYPDSPRHPSQAYRTASHED
jgi:ATP-dependent DNA helicase RecG